MNRARTGRYFEKEAADYLEREGYEILERNFRCKAGEIDLVAREGNILTFVEVKYRSSDKYGYPQEAVDGRKISRLRRAAAYYLQQKRVAVPSKEGGMRYRFDVVAILGREFTLIRNAF